MSSNKKLSSNTAVENKAESATKKVPFAVTEAYKTLRTNLISILQKENGKAIIISSPNASEGKSTTSINTAISLSQLNKKVLLIDTDAHRPSIHNKLKLKNDDGLMNIITGVSDIDDVINHYNTMLDIITTGPVPQNATEMFSDPKFEAVLENLKEKYDYIILDAPPVNLLSDSLVIAQKCDGIIYVIRAGVTTHNSLQHALASADQLGIKILGVVLNGTGTGSKRYYNKYYKSYY